MDQDFHLVCINPFGKYYKGQTITDAEEVAKLQEDREGHFVRIAAPPLPFAGTPDEPDVSKKSKGKVE